MGSRIWIKNVIGRKKAKANRTQKKQASHEQSNGSKEEFESRTGGSHPPSASGASEGNNVQIGFVSEDTAATRIQAAFRAYAARKSYRQARGMFRLKNLVQSESVKKQVSNTLRHLHSWSGIQNQIRARRANMGKESRLRQRKLESQLKVEAKIHDLEVDWTGGSETMDEALARIHQREAAAVRRERAMAYAFSHQWRANSNPNFGSGNYEISKESWGWSWMDRWIAVQPWERQVPILVIPNKAKSSQTSKQKKISPSSKAAVRVKLATPKGNAACRSRKVSNEVAEKTDSQRMNTKTEEHKTQT